MLNLTWETFRVRINHLANRHPSIPAAIYGIPTGGSFVAQALASIWNIPILDVASAHFVDEILVVDDIVDSGKTMEPYHKRGFACDALFRKPSAPAHLAPDAEEAESWVKFPWEHSGGPEDAVTRLLQFIGEDVKRGGLLETPARVVKAWKEWTSGYNMDPATCFKEFDDGAESYDGGIVLDSIPFYSHCEHHLAAIFGVAHIGYIPNGKIAGLSKFARLVDIYARRLQVQERMTRQIADDIQTYLNPQGVAVYVEGRHFCMESRGVSKPGVITKTTAFRGAYKENDSTRAEFMSLIGRK